MSGNEPNPSNLISNRVSKNMFNRPLIPRQQQMIDALNAGQSLESMLPPPELTASLNALNIYPNNLANLVPHITNVDSLTALLADAEITQDVFNVLLEDALDKHNCVLLKLMLADAKMADADKRMLNDAFKKRPYEMMCLMPK